MSNRIDLTQFEGMSEGKWEHDGGAIYAEEAERNNPIIAEYPSWNYNVKDNDGLLTVEDHCNLIAMAAVPDLIAELKRCYEEIDGLLETIGGWGYVMCPRSNEWFEWDYGCQSETCSSHDDDCRELVEASE